MVFRGKRKSGKGKKFMRKGKKRSQLINRSLTPFSQRFITSMKYSDSFSISALGVNRYMFNLNNIFDPNRTGVGHQPYGYDQLSTIYNRYRVISCSYTIEMYPSEGTAPIRVVALPANEEVSNSNMSDACEDPRAKWVVQVPGGSSAKLKGRIYLPSLLGRTTAEYRATQGPLFTGTPADLAVLNVYAGGLNDGAVNAVGVITLHYKIECFDPNTLPQS